MRSLTIATLYGLAFALLWAGSLTAPQMGWPTTDVEVHGCALLILGLVAKSIGHWQMLAIPRRIRRYA